MSQAPQLSRLPRHRRARRLLLQGRRPPPGPPPRPRPLLGPPPRPPPRAPTLAAAATLLCLFANGYMHATASTEPPQTRRGGIRRARRSYGRLVNKNAAFFRAPPSGKIFCASHLRAAGEENFQHDVRRLVCERRLGRCVRARTLQILAGQSLQLTLLAACSQPSIACHRTCLGAHLPEANGGGDTLVGSCWEPDSEAGRQQTVSPSRDGISSGSSPSRWKHRQHLGTKAQHIAM